MEENKDGCIFCRGEIPYVLCDGATLEINKNRIFGKDKYQEHEPNRFISINATSLFDCCPACGKSLGKNYPIDLDYSLITANQPKIQEEPISTVAKEQKQTCGWLIKLLRGGTNGR